jgi:hypothetical protein
MSVRAFRDAADAATQRPVILRLCVFPEPAHKRAIGIAPRAMFSEKSSAIMI